MDRVDLEKMEVKPITPEEIIKKNVNNIPPEIFTAVNTLLIEKSKTSKDEIVIRQDEILEMVCGDEKRQGKFTRNEVFTNNWLDIENYYNAAGWEVKYHQPPYYETWRAYFKFKFDFKK